MVWSGSNQFSFRHLPRIFTGGGIPRPQIHPLPGSCFFVPISCDFPLETKVLYFQDGLAYLRALTFLAFSTPKQTATNNADRAHMQQYHCSSLRRRCLLSTHESQVARTAYAPFVDDPSPSSSVRRTRCTGIRTSGYACIKITAAIALMTISREDASLHPTRRSLGCRRQSIGVRNYLPPTESGYQTRPKKRKKGKVLPSTRDSRVLR